MFIVGDKVFDVHYGWGKVIKTNSSPTIAPIIVKFYFGDLKVWYTADGRRIADGRVKVLSFTEYDLVNGGFSQKRPEID